MYDMGNVGAYIVLFHFNGTAVYYLEKTKLVLKFIECMHKYQKKFIEAY